MISGSQSSTNHDFTADPQELGLGESYVSPRLLRGVVPSVLLENYSFWEGEETVRPVFFFVDIFGHSCGMMMFRFLFLMQGCRYVFTQNNTNKSPQMIPRA